jgi:hypothetical protein
MLVLRAWTFVVVAVLAPLYAAPPVAQAQTVLRSMNMTPDVIGTVLQNYYRAPMADQIPAVIAAAMAQGMANERPRRLALIAFMAGLIAEDDKHLDRLAPVFHKLPGDQPQRLMRAINYSGRPDTADLFARLKKLWPDKVADIDTIAALGAKPVYKLKREGQPEVLDMNWAFFGATGRREPIMAIIESLADLKSTDNVRLATAHSARWSLASQAIQHDVVFEICQKALWGTYGNEVRTIIAAANSRDLSRFKTDAEDALKAAAAGQPVSVPAEAMAATARTPKRP